MITRQMQFGTEVNFTREQISQIQVPNGGSLFFDESGAIEINDLKIGLETTVQPLFQEFKTIVNQLAAPVFVLDCEILKR